MVSGVVVSIDRRDQEGVTWFRKHLCYDEAARQRFSSVAGTEYRAPPVSIFGKHAMKIGNFARRIRHRPYLVAAFVVLTVAGLGACDALRDPERSNVLAAGDAPFVTVMDFSAGESGTMALDPPPAGWWHRTFWTRSAAEYALAQKDGVAALKVSTDDSASMLVRFVDIDLAAYPMLNWKWFVEKPIDSAVDERTDDGDDHPARLYIAFTNGKGERRALEIIWGKRLLARGDVKFRGSFPHYVANGGNENIGRWHSERVDLMALFKRFWPDDQPGRITDIAIFCDSDETGASSIAYFADVRLDRGVPAKQQSRHP
jgi:hypothetical protein